MLNVFDGSSLSITQGNSADIAITLTDTDTGEPVELSSGDRVLFMVKSKRGETVIKKVLTANDVSEDEDPSLIVSLEPSDTMLPTGEYPYDVLLVTYDGQAVTFISSVMVICAAVGLYTDLDGDTHE